MKKAVTLSLTLLAFHIDAESSRPFHAHAASLPRFPPPRSIAANGLSVQADVTDELIDGLRAALAGRYRLDRELGHGGMSTVYEALDVRHDRQVAIKVLRRDIAEALGVERFLQEIKLTAKLNHPHILPLLDSGEAVGLPYYVMPFVAGESLRDLLERGTPLSVDRALAITREVADALDSAHRHGVVHRDIKPENILLSEGHAVVADFGIARAVAEAGGERLTATGLAIGTPVYMSPEQMHGDRDLDGRTDVYALACVTYEMLAGEPAVSGPSVEAVFARRLTEPPPRITQVNPGVPGQVESALRRAMAGKPDERFRTAGEFAAAIGEGRERHAPSSLRGLVAQRPYAVGTMALTLLVLIAVMVRMSHSAARRERARENLSRIALLADSGRFGDAYALAAEVERDMPGDTTLSQLMKVVADNLIVTSEPAGARVYLQRVPREATTPTADSVLVGQTPIDGVRVARGDYRVVVAKDGYSPVERIASSAFHRHEWWTATEPGEDTIAVHLTPTASTPPDMVLVPGGRYTLISPDAPVGLAADLDDYFIDKYEVSNVAFQRFVRAGGYERPEYWSRDFARGGPLGQAVSRQGLTDRTGLPGPRGWAGQEFPDGADRLPVTGVSWHEASAYCASLGKQLPTVFQWEKAARNGLASRLEGVMMPWGYLVPGQVTTSRANFSGDGPAPVDAYPFGIGPFGAYNMAGNVKEWTANPLGDGYGVTGGSWEDPSYLFVDYGTQTSTGSSPTLGFRCAEVVGPATGDQGAVRIPVERRTPSYTPVDAVTLQTLLSHYRYDNIPLDARIVDSTASADWVREEVRYVALQGDTALLYLYLPVRVQPPFQTIVYVASSSPFYQMTVPEEIERMIGPCIKAGRAVMGIVFKGMAERSFSRGWQPPEPSSVRYRDLFVLHATELRRGMDYLATRDDIDGEKLAYVGVSWGAGSHLPLAAVDDRYRAVVLIGGGIDERLQPTLPEVANFNFAPYIKPPKLLLNGREDEEHPWFTRALPLWNLLREPKELVLVDGAGHVPPLENRVPAINGFLDRTLGPVERR